MLCPVAYKGDSFSVLVFLLIVGKGGMQTSGRITSMSLLPPVVEQTGSTGISGQKEGKKYPDASLKINLGRAF